MGRQSTRFLPPINIEKSAAHPPMVRGGRQLSVGMKNTAAHSGSNITNRKHPMKISVSGTSRTIPASTYTFNPPVG